MISKNKINGINVVKLFVLSVIIVFIFHPLSLKPVSACSITKETGECAKCCCCSENNECRCKDNPATENDNMFSCMCELNTAETAEENESPANLFTNIQKFFAGIKSGLFVKTIDSDIKENSNLITSKTDTPVIKFGIYLEISSLRI